MPLVIPIQSVPSQQVACVLGNQNCQIAIYQKTQGLFVDLNSNGVDISIGILALNGVALNPYGYSGFLGNLMFIDTQGYDDPTYDGLGGEFQLVYLTPAEYAATLILNPLLYENQETPIPTVPNVLTDAYGNIIYTNTGAVIEVVFS